MIKNMLLCNCRNSGGEICRFFLQNYNRKGAECVGTEEKIADKSEVLEYLTNVMRDEEGSEKDRTKSPYSFSLARLLASQMGRAF